MTPPTTPLPVLLTPEEAAAALGVGRTTVFALLASGRLDRVHIGRCSRIPRVALDRFVAQLEAEAAHTAGGPAP